MKTAADFLKMISYGCGCCDGRSPNEIDAEILSTIQQAIDQSRHEAIKELKPLFIELSDNCLASVAESDISHERREYRRELYKRSQIIIDKKLRD